MFIRSRAISATSMQGSQISSNMYVAFSVRLRANSDSCLRFTEPFSSAFRLRRTPRPGRPAHDHGPEACMGNTLLVPIRADAKDDYPQVDEVRNYIELKGLAPLAAETGDTGELFLESDASDNTCCRTSSSTAAPCPGSVGPTRPAT